MILRTVLWAVRAVAVVVATARLQVELSDAHIRLLLPPKIPLFGIMVAIGTFQYRVWRDLVAWADGRLHDPRWVTFEQEAARRRDVQGTQQPGDARALASWQAHTSAIKADMRDYVLPHNRAILFNVLVVAMMLMVSSSADVTWLMVAPRNARALRVISTGTFVAVLGPMVEAAVRYFLALRREFIGYEREYRA
jgi:hypothetical protein